MSSSLIEPKNILLETQLLKLMSNRECFAQYSAYIDYKRVLPDTARLLQDYKKYYTLYDDHLEIDWNLFYTQFTQTWHTKDLTEEDIKYYHTYIFPAISAVEGANESVLIGLMQREVLENISTKQFDLEKIRDVLTKYEEKVSSLISDTDKEISTIVSVDFSVLDKSVGIPWCLPSLQRGLGALVKGQYVLIAANIGKGKSALVISQAATSLEWSLKYNQGCILYFNSEGTDADVFGRICSNLFKKQMPVGFEQIVENSALVRKQFINRYGENRLLVSQISHNSVEWVYSKILKYNPCLVIIDIVDSLSKEEDVISLKKLHDRLRIIAGLTCPIIGTTQSGDTSYQDKETGEMKTSKWLSDKKLYGSKVGKGGAADTIITIGADDKNKNLRYISTPKKKRGEVVYVTCELLEQYSLYRELDWG